MTMPSKVAAFVTLSLAATSWSAELPQSTREALGKFCGAATATEAGTPAAIEALLRQQPERALGMACASWRTRSGTQPGTQPSTPPDEQAQLFAVLAAAALAGAARNDEAKLLLATLESQVEPALPASADRQDHSQALWQAYWLLTSGAMAMDARQADRARAQFAQARARLESAGQTQTRVYASVLIGQAFELNNAMRLDAAERHAAEAQDLLQRLDAARSAEMSDLLNLRAMIAYARQDLPRAVELTRAEVALSREIGIVESELLHAYSTLGAVLSQLGRRDEAAAALREGLAIIDRHPGENPAGQLGILHNLAAWHLERGEAEPACGLAERAVALSTAAFGALSGTTFTPLVTRAQCHVQAARFGQALRDLERARIISRARPADVGVLRILRLHHELAGVHIALGDADSAREVVAAGLGQVTGAADLSYWHGRLLRRQALLSMRAGRGSDADAELAQAAALVGPVIGVDQPLVIGMVAERCEVQARWHLPGQACQHLRELLPKLQDTAAGFRWRAQAALAEAAEQAGDSEAALSHRLAALAAAESAGSADPRWTALDQLARHLRGRGDKALAVYFGKQSIVNIEHMRREIGAVAAAAERGFLEDKTAVYRRVAEWLFEDGRIDEGLDTLRLLKEEEFLDFVQRDAGLVQAPGRSRMSAAEQVIADRWSALPAASPQTEAGWAARSRQLVGELAAPAASASASSTAPPMPERFAADRPPIGELHVHAFSGVQQTTLVFESRHRRSVVSIDWERAAVGREVGAALAALGRHSDAKAALSRVSDAKAALSRVNDAKTALSRISDAKAALSSTGDVKAALRELYLRIGSPLVEAASAAGASRIVLHLDGALRYLPWSALHDGQHWLGDRFSFEIRVPAPSPEAIRSRDGAQVLAFGVSRPIDGLEPLRGVAREVCEIVAGPVAGLQEGDAACGPGGSGQGIVRGRAWLNEEFTAERIKGIGRPAAASGNLLHVGTHFSLRPGHMSRSWLLLGDGSRMTLDELAGVNFVGQDLVTLSACETGIGGAADADGREVDGLNLLVIRRGARAVLASLWRVDDRSTSVLMREFYRRLARLGPVLALQQAQQAVRSAEGGRWAAPFHWAGFYLTQRQAAAKP